MKKLLFFCSIVLSMSAIAQIDYSIKFKITAPNGHTDESILRLEQTATPYFDGQWDAWKIFTWNDSVPSLYSCSADSFAFAINAIPFMTEDTSLFLSMRVPLIGGTYIMETEQLGAFPPGVKVAIKDLENGSIYELNTNQSFNFDVSTSPLDFDRFEVFYSTQTYVDTTGNAAFINNLGCTNWSFELQDDSFNFLSAGSSNNQTYELTNLSNGNYHIVVTDNFGVSDSTMFSIFVEDTSSQDPPPDFSSLIEQGFVLNVYFTDGDYYLNVMNPGNNEMVELSYYSLNGSLMHRQDVQLQELNNRRLYSTDSPMILQLSSNTIRKTFKLMN